MQAKLLALTGLMAGLMIGTTPAHAQNAGPGLEIVGETYHHAAGQPLTKDEQLHPESLSAFDSPTLLQDTINAAWRSNKGQADGAIQDLIGQANLHNAFPNGVTLYHQNSSLASSGELQTTAYSNRVELTYTLRRNYLEFTSTTPTAAGKYADPRLSLTYDLTIALTIPINPTNLSLQVSSAKATVSNVSRPDTHNLAGDIEADIVAPVMHFFGGPDFLGAIQGRLNGQEMDITPQINQGLAPVNQKLQQLAGQGFSGFSASGEPQQRRIQLSVHKTVVDAPPPAPLQPVGAGGSSHPNGPIKQVPKAD